MRETNKYMLVFLIGQAGYPLIELLWRGYTHWTMMIAGGICLTALYGFYEKTKGKELWKKCVGGAIIIMGIEFMIGCVVNLVLRWNIWDYSNFPFHVLGQICPFYGVLWGVLCVPIFVLCKGIDMIFEDEVLT